MFGIFGQNLQQKHIIGGVSHFILNISFPFYVMPMANDKLDPQYSFSQLELKLEMVFLETIVFSIWTR